MRGRMTASALILAAGVAAGCGPLPDRGTVRESRPASGADGERRFASGLSAELPEGWYGKDSITLLSPDG